MLTHGGAMTRIHHGWFAPVATIAVFAGASGACSSGTASRATAANAGPRADLILTNARVYALAWGEPATDGTPAAGAPHGPGGWTPDAQAVAIRGSRIVFVGSNEGAGEWR